MKRVIIVHGWDGNPDTGWFPWLKQELETRDYMVSVPQMPDTGTPRIEAWIPAIAEAVGMPDEETYFVGHSMGCVAIARYLATLPEGVKVGGAVFVAGFFRPLTGLSPEDEEIDRAWYSTPLDLDKVRRAMKQSFALFSDNDPYVPVENAEDFKEKLGSEVLIQHEQSHFNEGAGFIELPIVLEKLLNMSA